MVAQKAIRALAIVMFLGSSASADVLCKASSGAAAIRSSCNAGETAVDPATLSTILASLSLQDSGATLRVSGVNLQVVSGSGSTDGTINGHGNLIIGYNANDGGETRTGSHNLVVGDYHTYSSFGGLVAGESNTISGEASCICGGNGATASGDYSAVCGGFGGQAEGEYAAVTGGSVNTAYGTYSSVLGGLGNTAHGNFSSVSGGLENTASSGYSAVPGGNSITCSGSSGTVCLP